MGAVDNAAGIGILRYWCQKILPAVYDDSLSYYELLCKVVDKVNEVVEQTNRNSEGIEDLYKRVNELNEIFNEFKAHGFDDYYRNQIEEWVAANLEAIMLKQFGFAVWFGLTDNGYFAAYYPETWKDISFDTGTVYGEPNYGCLELYY